jgi:hypothetical protein
MKAACKYNFDRVMFLGSVSPTCLHGSNSTSSQEIPGDTSAVKTPIWCAASTYGLIAIVKKDIQLDASLDSLRQILSILVFERSELSWHYSQIHHTQNCRVPITN